MSERKSLKIALMGTRGIPARYGGFETFAENLSARLVRRGHDVTVYCRRAFFQKNSGVPKEYLGVRLKYVPTVMQKYLETPLHSLLSLLTLFGGRYDAILLCNAANSPFAWIARLFRVPIAINVDGIERKRAKWNALGRLWYRLGEYCSVKFADRVIADADVIAEYYKERFNCESSVIAYGAEAVRREPGETLREFGLNPRGYILYVSRLEPENNALGVIQAYGMFSSEVPLVIVGDAPYAKAYVDELKRTAGKNVIFTGYQFGQAYQELQSNCMFYIQATEVGGTHPALIEAMAYGNAVIANGTPENREVLADAGLVYPKNDFKQLSVLMQELAADPVRVKELGEKAHERASLIYEWGRITDQYEALFKELTT